MITWNVRYGFIQLGEIPFRRAQGGNAYSLTVESDPRLPFPALRNCYFLVLADGGRESMEFVNESRWGSDGKRIRYIFDRGAGLIGYSGEFIAKGRREFKRGTIPLTDRVFDGLSLIRWIIEHTSESLEESLFFIGDIILIPIEISANSVKEDIRLKRDAEVIRAFKVDGRLKGQGIAGLSGKFSVWLSASDPPVPLRASVKIWIGEVIIELHDPEKGYRAVE